MINYERQILALNDVELEQLVREWGGKQKEKYVLLKRFSGSGDMGRDVVGFYSSEKHDGEWDNYQCKQYKKALPTDQGMLEIGKILYYSFKKHFTVPKNYYFVAPKGVNRNLEKYIFNPASFRDELIKEWSKYCGNKLIENVSIPLDDDLKKFIQSYDFGSIDIIDIDAIVYDEKFKNILVEKFGGEMLPAPGGEVPEKVLSEESRYIQSILGAYSQHDQVEYSHINDLKGHSDFERDIEIQRERYFSADAFKRYYRDNTVTDILDTLEDEVFNGVYDVSKKKYQNGFECMCSVMSQAANVLPSGKLALHTKVDVKQGYCHHFVNGGKLRWSK